MLNQADQRRGDYFDDLRSDLLVTWRTMRRAPGFAAVVLATLTLGIGANTAIFSVVRRVLIAPLPYRAPDQLYRLYTVPGVPGGDDDKLSAVELDALARDSHSLSGITAFGNYSGVTFTDAHTSEIWQAAAVAPNFFQVLGVHPMLGRAITEDDAAEGAPPVVVISHALWRRVFGSDPDVAGRTVQLNDASVTVIGVLPAAFVAPTFTADCLTPLRLAAFLRNPRYGQARVLRAVARVKEGVSRSQFESELTVLRPRLQARFPEIKNAGVFRPVPLHRAMVGAAGPVLLLVMAGAVLVLAVMCVNLSGLFLARARARRHELSIRAALGAGHGRLVRHILTEAGCYALAGGAAGASLAIMMTRAFVRMTGPMLPRLGDIRLDGQVLLFATLVSIACGIAFGLLPARIARRLNLRDDIAQTSSRVASAGRAQLGGARALVSTQIALAILLVVSAGLLTRTFIQLVRTDLGYQANDHVLTFRVNLSGARYRGEPGAAFLRTFLGRLRSLPGVVAAGVTTVSPWNGGLASVGIEVLGRPLERNAAPTVDFEIASDGFFEALGVRLVVGRTFTATDRAGALPVVVVSQSTARRFWPNDNAIGAQLRLDTGRGDSAEVRQVIGVVGDVRPSVSEDPVATIYVPTWQAGEYSGEYAVRARGDAAALVGKIQQVLRDIDPKLPLIAPRTVHDVLSASIARQRLAMALMASFGGLALLLSSLGIYSVMSYSVIARTREFGVRAALGAPRSRILLLVLRQGLTMTILGIVSGLAASLLATHLLTSLLVGISPHDAVSFVAAPLLLGGVASAAALLPALRATRVPPIDALRSD